VKLTTLRPVALSVIALLASAPAAFALDADDFGKKLLAAYTSSFPPSMKVSFGTGTVSGTTITYDGLTITSSASGANSVPTKFIFNGVAENADGSYTADSLTLPDMNIPLDKGAISIKNIALKHLYVANANPTNVLDSSRIFGDASIGPITVTAGGAPIISVDQLNVSNNFSPSQSTPNLQAINSTGYTSGLKWDITGAPDPTAIAQAQALGLDKLNGKMLETVSWTLGDGHLNLSEISVDIDKVGKLKFALDMTGYTPAFLQTLTSVAQSMAPAEGSTTADPNASAQASAKMLAAAQTLFLNGTSLRFDDASITAKLLDLFAQQQHVTKAQLVDQLVAAVAMADASSPSTPPMLTKFAQAAVRAYLTDPHSFEVRLAPSAPLGVLGMVGAVMQPETMMDQLGVQIVVNDKQITAADANKETGTMGGMQMPGANQPDTMTSPTPPAADATTPDATTPAPSTDSNATTDNSTSTDSGSDNSGAASDGSSGGRSGSN
jgi:hypothetical protein